MKKRKQTGRADTMLVKIKADEKGDRLDVFLSESEELEGRSRSFIQKLIKEGKISVNGKMKKAKYSVKPGDEIEVEIEEEEEDGKPEPQNIDLNIIYEDEDLAVVYKPQGMVVHPADGNKDGTLVNALLYHMDSLSDVNGGDIRPGIVHRIDKDTSGVLLVAKNNKAHESLAKQLEEHSVTRKYLALVEGRIKEDKGTVDAPIGRNPSDRKKMAVVEGGRRAVTHFRVVERFEDNTLVEAQLETGRTHQIRVHMKYIKHPVVGDPVYGIRKQRFRLEGQLLHAHTIGFIHPSTGEYMEFSYPLPDYFEEVLRKLKKLPEDI